jgi:hypothetical protein
MHRLARTRWNAALWIHCRAISVAAFLAIVPLSGCNMVKSDVTAFSAMTITDIEKRIYVAPYDQEQAQSLEWQTYARKIQGKLTDAGYVVTFDPSQAELMAFFGYGIDSGKEVQTSYVIPQWGVTGYSGAYTTGSATTIGNYTTYQSTTTLQPQYGPPASE